MRCGEIAETTNHALIECPISKAVWCLSRLGPLIFKKSKIPFADLLRQLAFDLSEVDLAFFCWMSWRLWGERNNTSHGKVINSSESILELGMVGLGEWSNLFYESPMKHGTIEGMDVWLPPRPGELKRNIDTAVISSANIVGVGGVVRDHNRFVCAAFAKVILGSWPTRRLKLLSAILGCWSMQWKTMPLLL